MSGEHKGAFSLSRNPVSYAPVISPETRILVLGCGGMLGDAVYHTFKEVCQVRATDIDLNAPWLSKVDVRDRAEVEKAIKEFDPHYVFHLAALVDLEYC